MMKVKYPGFNTGKLPLSGCFNTAPGLLQSHGSQLYIMVPLFLRHILLIFPL